jgi:ethanolamine ammonia-lyase small subunit
MPTTADPWAHLRQHTAARIALGRAGASLPTSEWLRFSLAHALARDAVHLPLDAAAVQADLQALGLQVLPVRSAAPDRATYLRRPDLGRRLDEASRARLQAAPPAGQRLVVVVADGLSALAVHRHAAPLLQALQGTLAEQGWAIGPVVLANQGRVALGDDAGHALAAPAVLVLLGERPGLSSPDSLGAYLTWAPRPGLLDAARNCVSNIRPEGLACGAAAFKIAWLLAAARQLGATGVQLKDESDTALLARPAAEKVQRLA